jgi:hypothetical protein
LAEDFGQFWDAYPNQVNRQAALRAFASVAPELEAILAGVVAYKASKPPDRNWMDPAKFLTDRRWEDRPAAVAARGARGTATLHELRTTKVDGKVYVERNTSRGQALIAAGYRGPWDSHGGWHFTDAKLAEFERTGQSA